jgi:hypothetical protein
LLREATALEVVTPVVRIPWWWRIMNGPRSTLVMCYHRHTAVARRHLSGDCIAAVTHIERAVVQSYLVLDDGVLDDAEIGAPVFVDIKCQLAEEFGVVHGSFVLAHPDGYVALHRIGLDPTVVLAAVAA